MSYFRVTNIYHDKRKPPVSSHIVKADAAEGAKQIAERHGIAYPWGKGRF